MRTEIVSGRGEGYIIRVFSGFDEEQVIEIIPGADNILIRFDRLKVVTEVIRSEDPEKCVKEDPYDYNYEFKTTELRIITHEYE